MSVDVFLKLDKIDGECDDLVHREWIELLWFSWGVRQQAGAIRAVGAADRSERCDFDEFTFRKTLDAASPKLAIACARGSHLKEALLEVCRAAGDKLPYYKIRLREVVVSSVKMEAQVGAEQGLPTETVALNFASMEWLYVQTDLRTGKPMGQVKACWDLKDNKGI